MHGCSLADEEFTLDPEIWGDEISWNITRIQRDAISGILGPPEMISISRLPPMGPQHEANIDRKKVSQMLAAHASCADGYLSPLNIPVLQIIFEHHGKLHRIPVDGNHRLYALMQLGLVTFDAYQVSAQTEHRYRITMEQIDA
jgi:hypothetical protein